MGVGRILGIVVITGLAAGAALFLLGAPPDESADPEAQETTDAAAKDAPALKGEGHGRRLRGLDASVDGADVLKRLKAADIKGRQAILLGLWERRDRERVRPDADLMAWLVAAVRARDKGTGHAAALALAALGPSAYPALRPLLDHAKPEVRMAALGILSVWAGRREVFPDPGWVALINDADRNLAMYAWRIVVRGVPYSRELADLCEARIDPENVGVWGAPENALANMGPAGLARILALLDTPEGPLVDNALASLRHVRAEELQPILERLAPWITTTHEDRQAVALQVVRNVAPDVEVLMPAFLEAWKNESFHVRTELLFMFEMLGKEAAPAVDVLLGVITDSDERIASRAMNVLGQTQAQPQRVLPLLRDALDAGGDDPAAIAMGAYGAAAAPYLRGALQSPDDDVRYFALAGVFRMGRAGASLTDVVFPMIAIDDEEIGVRAARAAGQMGPAGAAALPDIWPLHERGRLKHPEMAEILRGIGPAGEAALLARLASKNAVTARAALHVAASYGHGTMFALEGVAPFLTSKDMEVRRLALYVVRAAYEPPPTPEHPGGDGGPPRYLATAALRQRLRALLAPLQEDPDPQARGLAQSALAHVARMEAAAKDQNG